MKILTDEFTRTRTVVLEDFNPTNGDLKMVDQFVHTAADVHEIIGGLHFYDCNNQIHTLDFKNDALTTLLFVAKALSEKSHFELTYDDSLLTNAMYDKFFGKRSFLVRIFQVLGLIRKNFTYRNLIQAHHAKSGRAISK